MMNRPPCLGRGTAWRAFALAVLAALLAACAADRPPAPTTAASGNPFDGALLYVDPDYVAAVDRSAARVTASASDSARVAQARRFPTAVWLDRLAAVDGDKARGGAMGLADHLEAALQQQRQASGASGSPKPMVVPVVVYNLPDRDCAAAASNGELKAASGGLVTYKTQFIDRIAAILARPRYAGLRVVLLIEPDSYPNLLTNVGAGHPACDAVSASGVYVAGIRYALATFATLPQVTIYLDIAHGAWLGWPEPRQKAVAGFKHLIAGATPSGRLDIVRGFVTNTSNYTPLDEPFFDGTPDIIRSDGTSTFYGWNPAVDELSYIDLLQREMRAAGFPQTVSFVVDTSRNGWGGSGRPARAASRVDEMRIDRRAQRSSWCNVNHAGIGERPRARPDAARPYLDAYLFVKPPGASDGTSDRSATAPNAEGKRFDPMCGNPDALPGAPHAGHWFHEQFLMLLRNAEPPLR